MNKSGRKSGSAAPDRRVQKTRQLLSEALVSLILEKGYEDVSIQDLLDRANVGRSTFYAHYENKEQLLLFGHEHLRNLAVKEGAEQIDFLSFYQHLAERRTLVEKLLSGGKSEELITRSLRGILHHSISRLYLRPESPAGTKRPLLALRSEAAAAALVQLMTSWIQEGMPLPPEKMAEESSALMRRILLPDAGL